MGTEFDAREPPASSAAGRGPLGAHPATDGLGKLEYQRMQAAIERRMFGRSVKTNVGRFSLLEPIGRGGMGRVFSAYDPKLDRKVAVKVLRSDRGAGGTRLLREARALAKLSHPNVVTVYEVGEIGEQGEVFIAMEFLAGGTLRDWFDGGASPRPWQDVISMFVDVGRGLVAAHHARLVHRDFKPDNVLIGSDGRPRVADFGLARLTTPAAPVQLKPTGGSSAKPQSIAGPFSHFSGTPDYVSPEQARGDSVDARSDQYSFCVSLFEALFGVRPSGGDTLGVPDSARARAVPVAVIQAVRRGLSVDPNDRFGGLEGLLAAIAPRPAAVERSKALLVGAGVVAAAVALTAIVASREPVADPCAIPRQRLADSADLPESLGAGPDERAHYQQATRTFRASARAELDEACSAETVEPVSVDCLSRSLLQLAAVDDAVRQGRAAVRRGTETIKRLTDPALCTEPEYLGAVSSLPSDPQRREAVAKLYDRLSSTQVVADLGFEADASAQARQLLQAGTELPDDGVRAAALLQLGKIAAGAGRGDDAVIHFREAVLAADAAGHDWQRAETLLEFARSVGVQQRRSDEATELLARARAAVTRLGDPARLTIELAIVDGSIAFSARRLDDAVEKLRTALADSEALWGPDHFELVAPLNVLAASYGMLGDFDAAFVAFERARVLVEHHYGRRHPIYAQLLSNLGATASNANDPSRAKVYLEESLALTREVRGPDHAVVAVAGHNLADVLSELGAHSEAEAVAADATAAAERAHGANNPQMLWSLVTFATVQQRAGHSGPATLTAQRALGLGERERGEDALQLISVLLIQAENLGSEGRTDDQRAVLTRIVEISKRHDTPVDPEVRAALDTVLSP
ncbi:MAG: tetratricopeptide repeat protein [Nannocystaceae bacterium]|nr:tetratricopeptide repeat protein [Nannocystaceae bacterium]